MIKKKERHGYEKVQGTSWSISIKQDRVFEWETIVRAPVHNTHTKNETNFKCELYRAKDSAGFIR